MGIEMLGSQLVVDLTAKLVAPTLAPVQPHHHFKKTGESGKRGYATA